MNDNYSLQLNGTHITKYSDDLQINYLIFSYQSKVVRKFTEFTVRVTPQLINYATHHISVPSTINLQLTLADSVQNKSVELPKTLLANSTVLLDSEEFVFRVKYSRIRDNKITASLKCRVNNSYSDINGYFYAYSVPRSNLIEWENKVPQYYRDSRDFNVFLNMSQLVMADLYSKVKNPLLIMDPLKCDISILPLLYSYLGATYNYEYPEELSRYLLYYMPDLIKYRGSMKGIKLAVAVASLYSDKSRTIDQIAKIETTDHEGYPDPYIYIHIYSPEVNLRFVSDIVNLVRPVGTYITIHRAIAITAHSQLNFYDSAIPTDTITIYNDEDSAVRKIYYDDYGRAEFLEKMKVNYETADAGLTPASGRPDNADNHSEHPDLYSDKIHSVVGFSQISKDGSEFNKEGDS